MKYENAEAFVRGGSDFLHPCNVLLVNDRLVIEYELAGVRHRYSGHKSADGSYPLSSSNGGTSVLREDPHDEMILEGKWVEGNEEGSWRINLGRTINCIDVLR